MTGCNIGGIVKNIAISIEYLMNLKPKWKLLSILQSTSGANSRLERAEDWTERPYPQTKGDLSLNANRGERFNARKV